MPNMVFYGSLCKRKRADEVAELSSKLFNDCTAVIPDYRRDNSSFDTKICSVNTFQNRSGSD